MAALAPWTTLAASSNVKLVENPAAADANIKMVNPTTYICFRPTMSDNRPIGKSRAEMVRASLMDIHITVVKLASKCLAMVGKAIKTLPWPSTDMNVPVATVPKTHHL